MSLRRMDRSGRVSLHLRDEGGPGRVSGDADDGGRARGVSSGAGARHVDGHGGAVAQGSGGRPGAAMRLAVGAVVVGEWRLLLLGMMLGVVHVRRHRRREVVWMGLLLLLLLLLAHRGAVVGHVSTRAARAWRPASSHHHPGPVGHVRVPASGDHVPTIHRPRHPIIVGHHLRHNVRRGWGMVRVVWLLGMLHVHRGRHHVSDLRVGWMSSESVITVRLGMLLMDVMMDWLLLLLLLLLMLMLRLLVMLVMRHGMVHRVGHEMGMMMWWRKTGAEYLAIRFSSEAPGRSD